MPSPATTKEEPLITMTPSDTVDALQAPTQLRAKAPTQLRTQGRRTAPIEPSEPKFRFRQAALANLSTYDQVRFEKFGAGRRCVLPHTLIHGAVEQQTVAQPDAIAVEHLGEAITYRELGRRSDLLAWRLHREGVRAGDVVGLFVSRSIPMVVGMLAVLKVGAAYAPQDVRVAPESQLRDVVELSGARLVLTLGDSTKMVERATTARAIALDGDTTVNGTETAFPTVPVDPSNRCFVLFTSGTTGRPNGVQVTHRNVCNIVLTDPGDLGIGPGVRVAQMLSVAFDMAQWEVLGCLANGGTLVIRGTDFNTVAANVEVLIATPSVLARIDPDVAGRVTTVAVAGEPCPRSLAERWSAIATFYNSCGPTETTIINTARPYRPGDELLTIGSPTPNNTVYVLDENQQPLPIGEIGEMWAGGECVTSGYVGNDELTHERYRPDPFLGGDSRMFRTRDLGRWTLDGGLEHFGRTDDQVKVRGFRVELDSVSVALESSPTCERAVTVKLDDRSLGAIVIPSSADVGDALRHVDATLPYYCRPERVLALDELPLTTRGKVDRRRAAAMLSTGSVAILDEIAS